MKWIPITDKMPKPSTRVLVTHNPYSDIKEVAIAEWFEWYSTLTKKTEIAWHQDSEYVNVDGYDACLGHEELKVTHWMPLIDPA
jgi:hypothetical protein